MTNDGILAIWHDVDAAIGDDYERWYFREHLPERIGVPGFVAGRRYEAVEGAPKFLTYYEGKSPDIFVSTPYLARLNDPTPWTTSVLRHFRDTNRTVCRRTWATGSIRGAWGVVLRVDRNGEKEDGVAAGAVAALEGQGRAWAGEWRGAPRRDLAAGGARADGDRRRKRTSGRRRTGSSKGRCSPISPARRMRARPRESADASCGGAETGGVPAPLRAPKRLTDLGVAIHFPIEELAARRAAAGRAMDAHGLAGSSSCSSPRACTTSPATTPSGSASSSACGSDGTGA